MKQRLVGAIVLVAVAVIFLPMLLDGSGHSGPHEISMEIPAEPQPPANRLTESVDFTDAGLRDALPTPETSAVDSGAKGDESARPAGGDAGPASDDGDVGQRGSAEEGASADPANTEREAARVAEEDAGVRAQSGSSSQGPTAWVVQVGSFTRETNALVLRDRLREADFDAFAERAQADNRTVWRVRIGPVGTRSEAEQLSERIQQERGGPALVMAHP